MADFNGKQNNVSGGSEIRSAGERKKILIIEDDQFLRDLVSKKLEASGMMVLKVIDGREAMSVLKDSLPDLILLDLVLPGMDGFEFLRILKQNPETRPIPVIVLSNLGQKGDVIRAQQLGAEEYLIKAHTDLGEIVEKTKNILSKRR